MKICIVSRGVDKKGGISRYNAELAERFCLNNEVHLLTYKCELVNPYLNIHRYRIPEKPYFLQISTSFFKVSKLIKELDIKFNFDVIHSSECESTYQDVITAHSCVRGAFEKLGPNNPFVDFLRSLRPFTAFGLIVEKFIYTKHKYKKVIAVSEGVKREIISYYKIPEEDIVVIPNGVDIEKFKPNSRSRKKIRERYGLNGDEIVLIFSGHEFRRKGLKYIIEALPMIEGDVKLLVVGRDDPTPYKKLASKFKVLDKVIFAGFVPQVNEYYAASDIFVFPTAYEAYSLATLEAVASGLPIIATKVNGTEDLIKNGYNGFFIKADPTDIAEKINILAEDKRLRVQMSKNARKTAKKHSWDEVVKQTLRVYEEVSNR